MTMLRGSNRNEFSVNYCNSIITKSLNEYHTCVLRKLKFLRQLCLDTLESTKYCVYFTYPLHSVLNRVHFQLA